MLAFWCRCRLPSPPSPPCRRPMLRSRAAQQRAQLYLRMIATEKIARDGRLMRSEIRSVLCQRRCGRAGASF